jgi:hypothetical protein
MTKLFNDWSIDVKIAGTWTALKSDVLQTPGPRWGRGILGNGPLDRTGDSITLTFSLRNDDLNMARLSGRYSPGHANCLTGWTTGLPVRLWFQAEAGGMKYYKFYGLIAPDGISPDAGPHHRRTVRVTVNNFMAQMANAELNLLARQLNKRIDEALTYIVANMVIQPLATDFATGIDTFPTIFDAVGSGSRALSEAQAFALSEFGYVYDRGDQTGGETLVVENRNTRSNVGNTQILTGPENSGYLMKADGTGYILTCAGDKIIYNVRQSVSFDNLMYPETMQVKYGKNQANRIRAITPIRKVDTAATTVLYDLPSPIQMTAGQTLTVRGSYRDPSGGASYVNADSSTMSDAFTANSAEDGSGSNLTSSLTVTPSYGTAEVSFVLTAAVALWVTSLQAIGKGIYLYDPLSLIYEDVSAQAAGVFPLAFDMRYQSDPTKTGAIAQYTLGLESNPNVTVDRAPILANRNEMTFYGFLELEPGTRATFIEDQTGINGDYFIMGYEAEMFAGQYVIWSPCLKDASQNNFWIWDVSEWDVDNTWGLPE